MITMKAPLGVNMNFNNQHMFHQKQEELNNKNKSRTTK
jgi:hypothetical protein